MLCKAQHLTHNVVGLCKNASISRKRIMLIDIKDTMLQLNSPVPYLSVILFSEGHKQTFEHLNFNVGNRKQFVKQIYDPHLVCTCTVKLRLWETHISSVNIVLNVCDLFRKWNLNLQKDYIMHEILLNYENSLTKGHVILRHLHPFNT